MKIDLGNSRILVTGGAGLVGRHLLEELKARGARTVVAPRSAEYDLRKPDQVEALFASTKPDVVFSLAAKVGGILDNKQQPADFYFENTLIGTYVFDACARHKVRKLLNLGAGCGYPLAAPEPLREADLWNGFPQPESAAYSLVKKMLIIQGIAYRQQTGLSAVTLIPSNIYGAWDNFNLTRAHVVPALVRKFFEATRDGHTPVNVWGDGEAKRDFIHAGDVAAALAEAAVHYDSPEPLNVAYGRQYSIRETVDVLTHISGYHGKVEWDTSRPTGQKSREFSIERLRSELPGFRPRFDLDTGLRQTYEWLSSHYAEARL